IEDFVRADHMLTARKFGNKRPATGGDDNTLRREGLVSNGNGMGVNQLRSAVHQSHPGRCQQIMIDAIEAGDLGILVLDQTLPIELRLGQVPAITLGITEVLGEMGRIGEQLFRHTANVDTGTAEIQVFGYRHPRTKSSRHAAGAHTTRSGTDNEKVKIIIRHTCCPATETSMRAYPIAPYRV